MVASVGCQVMFSCLDAGLPPLQFQWTFNDLPLPLPPGEAGPEAQVRRSGELVLSDLQLDDSGIYSCTVTGQVGVATAVALLMVEDPVFASGVPSAPPTIASPTPSIQVLSVGQAAQFVCLVEGFPPPEVVWLRDGEPHPNLRRASILREGLSLRDVRVTDVGVYECVASNALGQASIQFILNITCMFSKHPLLSTLTCYITAPPVIISHPLPQEVSESDSFTLLCSATGNPAPTITWQLDGSEVGAY